MGTLGDPQGHAQPEKRHITIEEIKILAPRLRAVVQHVAHDINVQVNVILRSKEFAQRWVIHHSDRYLAKPKHTEGEHNLIAAKLVEEFPEGMEDVLESVLKGIEDGNEFIRNFIILLFHQHATRPRPKAPKPPSSMLPPFPPTDRKAS